MLYTAQYRYTGPDRLDITVKGEHPVGKVFAPTWHMVNSVKNGGSEKNYTEMYYTLMTQRWQLYRKVWDMLVQMCQYQDVTVVCFCPSGAFCHRHILVDILKQYNSNIRYGGERVVL